MNEVRTLFFCFTRRSIVKTVKEMLALAHKNKQASGVENAEFVKSRITDIPIESDIADCVISNCVINLVPEGEKHLVFKEVFRILKPGGRLAVSDILATKELPQAMKDSIALYCGCIAGASQVKEYKDYMKDAGFRGEMKHHV
jgi:arsenite methyltransferase